MLTVRPSRLMAENNFCRIRLRLNRSRACLIMVWRFWSHHPVLPKLYQAPNPLNYAGCGCPRCSPVTHGVRLRTGLRSDGVWVQNQAWKEGKKGIEQKKYQRK